MATRNFPVLKDARVGTDGSLNLGAGACNHLPAGTGGGYTYYSLIKFDTDWTDVTTVSAADLYLTNTGEYHLTRAGSRQFYLDIIDDSWNAGSASHPMTTSNSVVWPGPNTFGTREYGPYTCQDTDDHQKTYDVMALIHQWAPSHVYVDGYGYGQGVPNSGLRIIYASGDDVEFYSSEKGGTAYVPKIKITYSTNNLPTLVIDSPSADSTVTGGTTYATPSVTVGATATDADGDSITNVQFQFASDSGFSTVLVTSTADDDTAGVVSRAVSSASLPRGSRIYLRGRASDAEGYGDWSDSVSFFINDADQPSITGTSATVMEMLVEDTDTAPCAVVRFTYSDPEGQSISRYVCKLQDSTGVTTYETKDVSVSVVPSYVKFDYASLVHGTTYKFSVETFDASGLSAGAVTQNRVAKWAVREEYHSVSSVTAWTTSTSKTEAADTRAVIQHGAQYSGAAGTDPSNWTTDLSSLTPSGATYYWVRYWLFAWNGAATSGVSVTGHTLTVTSSSLTADGWTLSTGASITTARSWYGTRCLRIDGVASNPGRYASITVTGFKIGQQYTVSGRVLSTGDSQARLRIYDGSTIVKETEISDATDADFVYRYATFTAASESYTFFAWMDGDAGTSAMFDACKIEEGAVATPWTPGVLSRSIVVDGNGIQVDGRGSGVFRVRGSSTSTAETEVDLSDLGLRFSSPVTLKEIAAPASPASGYHRLYMKSDGKLYRKNSSGTETEVGGGGSASPTTTRGDIIRRGASVDERYALGTTRKVLTSDGTDPVWDYPSPSAANSTSGSQQNGLTTNGGGTYIQATNFGDTITPEWENQQFLIILATSVQNNNVNNPSVRAAIAVNNSAAPAAVSNGTGIICVAQGSCSTAWVVVGTAGIFTAAAGDVGNTRYVNLWVSTAGSSNSQTTDVNGNTRIVIVPLPAYV